MFSPLWIIWPPSMGRRPAMASSSSFHAQDLAAPDIEVHPVDGHGTLVAADGQVPDLQQGAGLFHHGALDVQVHLVAHHELGELLLIGLGGVYGGDVLSLAEDGDPVGDLQHLVELVGDDDDGVALEELGCLLDGKDGGGLVQDDDLGPVVEHLDDLQGLLLRHRHIVHLFPGVDVKAEFFGHLPDLSVPSPV